LPRREKVQVTFDNIADVIERFTEVIGFDRFAAYVFDYGAPTGFRLAIRHPGGSPLSFRRKATSTRKALATAGIPSGRAGKPLAGESKRAPSVPHA